MTALTFQTRDRREAPPEVTGRHVSHALGEHDRTFCGAPWQGWQLNSPRHLRQRADGLTTPGPHLPPKGREEIHKCQDCYGRKP